MCGKDTELYKTDIEGSIMNLCKECAKFGKVISPPTTMPRYAVKKQAAVQEERTISVIEDFGERIKKKREESALSQEEFAKKLNEKLSIIHKLETGQFVPPIRLALKIEKCLGIKILEQQKIESEKVTQTKGEHFTIGDYIKVRKK
ncbi:MAG TPA: multiprotein bridging factor aMBF1 [Candidatus Nanoarchaeia archaeon]|nr:multiprotein bridging factor aMBF1 [Candidatus Nanoarchaeia archaeon]